MRDYLQDYGIKTYINAHDTITLYGASRMADETKAAMEQVSRVFVDIPQMQRVLGQRIAEWTHNEGAYIANCASGAVQLCAAVCMVQGSEAAYRRLPCTDGLRSKILVLHSQHNCYDKALEAAGAQLELVGDADETLECDLRSAIDERTAALFYCPASVYRRGSMPLSQAAAIAHEYGIPVIVDAAAQLPPIDNLWRFTQEGADLAVFSGGKTLCGPQTSGLIVGQRALIEDCIRFGAPMHGVCRSAKASRESMIGLTVALERYLQRDETAENAAWDRRVEMLLDAMRGQRIFEPYKVDHGSVGQSYPRAFAKVLSPATVEQVTAAMAERGIWIGSDPLNKAIYLSPLNLTDKECEIVARSLCELAESTNEK